MIYKKQKSLLKNLPISILKSRISEIKTKTKLLKQETEQQKKIQNQFLISQRQEINDL